jgi:glutaredoxin-like protein NrdH
MSAVTVWSKPACVQCKAVYRAFDKAGVEYEVKNLPDFPDQLEAFKAQELMSAPVVEAAGVKTFAGFNPAAVAEVVALHGVGDQ